VLEVHLLLGQYGLKPAFSGLMTHLFKSNLIKESKIDERRILVAAARFQSTCETVSRYNEGQRTVVARQVIARDRNVKRDLLQVWDGKCDITGLDLTGLPSDCVHLSHKRDNFLRDGGAIQFGDARLVYQPVHALYDRLADQNPGWDDETLVENTRKMYFEFVTANQSLIVTNMGVAT
jgi:hypothetical protein